MLGLPEPNPTFPEYVPRWQGTDTMVHPGLINPNIGGFVGTLIFPNEDDAILLRPDDSPIMSFYDAGPDEYTVPRGSTPEQFNALAEDHLRRYEQVQAYFKRWGMVKPTPRENIDQTIEWLFLDLLFPDLGWRRKAACINQELEYQQQRLHNVYYPDEPPRVHAPYNYDAVAYHTNRLRELLQIERPPGRPKRFG